MGTRHLGITKADLEKIQDRYELFEEVGSGGMAIVYRGRHITLDKPVAIKLCKADPDTERFAREARTLAKIHSAHIVPVHDFIELADGRGVFVMDWIESGDLGKAIDSDFRYDQQKIIGWMKQVCRGMQDAANLLIVHRDLKPSNILIDENDKALVADFGLARSLDEEPLTQTGQFMGTFWYMAPEQAEDPHTVDTRADVYSFGATFYHILTGKPPFEGKSPFEIMFKHKLEPLRPPKSLDPTIPDRINECIERCLAKDPKDRFQNFDQLVQNLGEDAPPPWSFANESLLLPFLKEYQSHRSTYLSGEQSEFRDEYKFPAGRKLLIQSGDITKVAADVLVSSASCYLEMDVGVALALLKAGGKIIRDEAKKYVPVREGRTVVTSAGKLQARFVFHAVTIGWQRPSRDIVAEIMENCFYQSDSFGIESIAFPLLGSGAGGFPRDICLDTMFRFLTRKLFYSPTTIREATIVIYPKPTQREKYQTITGLHP